MKKIIKNVFEVVGAILCILLFVLLVWLYLVVTPDQYSAECESLREEMREKDIIE